MESEANAEVDRIMEELTADVLGKAAPTPTAAPPVKQSPVTQQEEVQEDSLKVRDVYYMGTNNDECVICYIYFFACVCV